MVLSWNISNILWNVTEKKEVENIYKIKPNSIKLAELKLRIKDPIPKAIKLPPVKTAPTTLPPIQLRVVISGIVFYPPNPVALMKINGEKGTFSEADLIQNNKDVFIKKITPFEVIISNRGVDQNFELQYNNKAILESTTAQQKEKTPPKKNSSTLDISSQKELKQIIASIKKNPVSIVNYVNVAPIFSDKGIISSIKITSKKTKKLQKIFTTLGFEENDSVLAVNGKKIGDLASNLGEAFNLVKSKVLKLLVKRKSFTKEILIDLK